VRFRHGARRAGSTDGFDTADRVIERRRHTRHDLDHTSMPIAPHRTPQRAAASDRAADPGRRLAGRLPQIAAIMKRS
jgi:hypothetical protein